MRKLLLGLLLLAVATAFISACGSDDDEASAEADAAFVAQMVPHHESAIEMAKIAQDRAQHPQVKRLADDIVATQTEEIGTLNQISDRLGDEDTGASMGMSSEQMGMTMDASALETAKPFDREFIDMMISHHQGAITMARAELENGSDEEAKALAREIIEAQSAEIEQMNQWRQRWYGAPSPSGGVPEADSSSPMDHESMGM